MKRIDWTEFHVHEKEKNGLEFATDKDLLEYYKKKYKSVKAISEYTGISYGAVRFHLAINHIEVDKKGGPNNKGKFKKDSIRQKIFNSRPQSFKYRNLIEICNFIKVPVTRANMNNIKRYLWAKGWKYKIVSTIYTGID